MTQRSDPNALIREVQRLARQASALAAAGANAVAAQSAGHFLQGAFDAYCSRDQQQLEHNAAALRLLVAELQARTPRS